MERRLAALLAADIVGYSERAAQDEPGALQLIEILQALSRGIMERHKGRVVKFLGDAVLAEFPSTETAVRAAAALSQQFFEESGRIGRAHNLRIGVHVGDVAVDADGAGADDDCFVRGAAVADGVALRLRLRTTAAGEGGDRAGFQIEPANTPVGDVGDQQAALFTEFRETGMNVKLKYDNVTDLRANYPDFFWKSVRPYIGDALRYLRVTQEGQQWIANLYANVFSMEHRGQLLK